MFSANTTLQFQGPFPVLDDVLYNNEPSICVSKRRLLKWLLHFTFEDMQSSLESLFKRSSILIVVIKHKLTDAANFYFIQWKCLTCGTHSFMLICSSYILSLSIFCSNSARKKGNHVWLVLTTQKITMLTRRINSSTCICFYALFLFYNCVYQIFCGMYVFVVSLCVSNGNNFK